MLTVNWYPDRSQLRSFGLVCLVVFGALGGWVFVRGTLLGLILPEAGRAGVAVALWVLAALSGILAVSVPSALGPLYRALTAASLPIGFVVSHVVMAILFFGVLTPIGLVFRLVGRDRLARQRDSRRGSYWEPRARTTSVERYYRQY